MPSATEQMSGVKEGFTFVVREVLKAQGSRPAPSFVGREAKQHLSGSPLDREFAPQQ